MILKKTILYSFISIFVIISLGILYIFTKKIVFKYYTISQNQIERYKKNRDSLILNSKQLNLNNFINIDTNAIVFIGNSLTAGFEFDKYFPNSKLVNKGEYGNVTYGIILKIDQTIKIQPNKIFIEIGINDILSSFPMDTIKNNYKQIIGLITKRLPETKIYCHSILPVNFNDKKTNIIYNKNIVEINIFIKSLSNNKTLFYIDLNTEFSLNGNLNPIYDSGDHLHLNSIGYKKWSSIISPYIYE